MKRYLANSQPCPTNDRLNAMRFEAFKKNGKATEEYYKAISAAFQSGDLVAHELAENIT